MTSATQAVQSTYGAGSRTHCTVPGTKGTPSGMQNELQPGAKLSECGDGGPGPCQGHTVEVRTRQRKGMSTTGTSMLEFALVAPMLLLLVFAVFDFARLFYVEMNLQNAVREAGRYGITGNHLPDSKHPGQALSRVNSIIQVAQQAAIGIDVSNIQISSVGGGSGSAGGPGDTLIISLTTDLQLMTPIVAQFFNGGKYTFTVGVSLKNEPFPPGNTS